MSPVEIVAILAMTGYAIYRQTVTSAVRAGDRFKLAIIYGIVGVAVGGFALPHGTIGYTLLVGSLVLSAIVGLLRGRATRVWVGDDGRAMQHGNAVTILLFVGLVAAKFALGTYAYFQHIQDGAGFGEIMVMIAIMVAFQAEIVFRRGQRLTADSRRAENVLV